MRALLIVLDSAGVGGAPDAAAYGDEGSNTLGHILEASPSLKLPTLSRLGLHDILARNAEAHHEAAHGWMREASTGKDTTTGHWEIAGSLLKQPFPTFESFPETLLDPIEAEGGVHFIGNIVGSGTAILDDYGPEHLRTGNPILYTSADSVMQIAAHEEIIPPEKLYALCKIARKHADPWQIGRIIARPFEGAPGSFRRTPRRHDYSMLPPRTILNALCDASISVTGVGKISDIFAHSGITASHSTESNRHGMETIDALWPTLDGLLFANLVDFDMLFGHRRDVAGYAASLSEFDAWLETFLPSIRPDDLVMITADHGNDPTWHGTDHTREEVPIWLRHSAARRPLGLRTSFTDIAATLATHFNLAPWPVGNPMI